MREIKFRGKVSDEPNEWVIGYLIDDETIYQKVGHENSKCCECGSFSVDRETIGQYIGLKDKNGKEIFEGDIVNAQYFFENYDPYTLGAFEDEGEITGKIIFDLDGFRIVDKDDEGRQVPLSMLEDSEVQVEVLGNVYDNLELLEGKDDVKD